MDITAMRNALADKQKAELELASAARRAGIQVLPSPHLDGGRPILMVSPDVFAKMASTSDTKEAE